MLTHYTMLSFNYTNWNSILQKKSPHCLYVNNEGTSHLNGFIYQSIDMKPAMDFYDFIISDDNVHMALI